MSCDLLDTESEPSFDEITQLAALICDTPIALVSLVDEARQWFKSRVGLQAMETSREIAFCSHAILAPDVLFEIPDASRDERFCNNPLVTGPPNIRFYAGAPLVTEEGFAVGTLCVIDTEPRQLNESQKFALMSLARQVVAQMKLRRVVKDLERSNSDLEQFSYVASHDLQEPLRTTTSFVELLNKHYSGQLDERADEYIKFAVDGTRRMKTLIEDLLNYSLAGSDFSFNDQVDFGDIVTAVCRDYATQIDAAGVVIHASGLPVVASDAIKLPRLMGNLIGNAVKYRHPTAPEIWITAEAQGKHWRFCVRDNGIGIKPEDHERIFRMFQRLHGVQDYPGTGIGLAICQRIVTQAGGSIWVESEPGQGSSFYFTIPR